MLYEHEKEGWGKERKTKNVRNVHVEYVTHRFSADMDKIPEEIIKRELAYKLGKEILENDLCNYYRTTSNKDFTETFAADIFVTEGSMQYYNRTDDVFKVHDEIFTNEELIEAVKSHFAERFI